MVLPLATGNPTLRHQLPQPLERDFHYDERVRFDDTERIDNFGNSKRSQQRAHQRRRRIRFDHSNHVENLAQSERDQKYTYQRQERAVIERVERVLGFAKCQRHQNCRQQHDDDRQNGKELLPPAAFSGRAAKLTRAEDRHGQRGTEDDEIAHGIINRNRILDACVSNRHRRQDLESDNRQYVIERAYWPELQIKAPSLCDRKRVLPIHSCCKRRRRERRRSFGQACGRVDRSVPLTSTPCCLAFAAGRPLSPGYPDDLRQRRVAALRQGFSSGQCDVQRDTVVAPLEIMARAITVAIFDSIDFCSGSVRK